MQASRGPSQHAILRGACCATLCGVTVTFQRGDRLAQAAVATAATFFLSGLVFGTWVSRLPAVRDQLGANTAELGVALLMPGLGSLLSMPFMGAACSRWGSRRMVAIFGSLAIAVLPALAAVRTVAQLGLVLLVFGIGFGAWDVSMNVQGSAVEREAGREWMPRYHAGWSIGGIAGAGFGALAARADIEPLHHFAIAACASIVLLGSALAWFIREHGVGRDGEIEHEPTPRPRLLSPRLVAIGIVTVCATSIEGAAADWLAIYLSAERAIGDAGAAAGYMVFALAMATGRLAGTSVIERYGRVATMRAAGLLTGVGVVVTVTAPWAAGAYGGAALWGLGVAVIFPAAMSAAGEAPGRPGDGIAAVSTIGYAGFLLGPPVIGVIGHATGLGPALLVLLVVAAAAFALAPALRPPQVRPAHDIHA